MARPGTMDATPGMLDEFGPAGSPPAAGRPALPEGTVPDARTRWPALMEAAAIVARLARIPLEPLPEGAHQLPEIIAAAPMGRRALAEQGVEDLAAIMMCGLSALLAVHRKGLDASWAAQSLWEEFRSTTDALLRLLVPCQGEMPPAEG